MPAGSALDRFDAMRAFARVVEAGSFTKAATTLGMSRTTVTQLVQQLEARLRVQLLNRTTRKVALTADGAVYYERVIRLLSDLDELDGSMTKAQTRPAGRLRVGSTGWTCRTGLSSRRWVQVVVVEGGAPGLRTPHDSEDDVRLLTEVLVAELVAARLWLAG